MTNAQIVRLCWRLRSAHLRLMVRALGDSAVPGSIFESQNSSGHLDMA